MSLRKKPTGMPKRMALPRLLPFIAVALSLTPTISAQSYSNITRGTTLTAGGSTSTWRSPSGDFAFGFYATGSDNASLFLLAIWFDSIVPKSVIWFANGNIPVSAGSTLQLTSDGRLTLRDQGSTEVWSSSVGGATSAAILDTGNLVLVGDTPSIYLWQSFSDPKDTILPGQALAATSSVSSLRSKLTETDFSDGRFLLVAQADGNFELRPLALGSGNPYKSYWSIATADSGAQLVYNLSGSLYFAFSNGTSQNVTSAASYSAQDYYQRATMDPDGVFRQYIYPKNGGKAWNVVGGVPLDFCRAINFEDVGSGACGYNSYCVSATGLAMLNCECPPQYSFIDPQQKYKGCAQNFLTDCKRYDSSMFEMISMPNVDWPFSDYEHYTGVDVDTCKQYCLEDCFCAVAIFGDQNGCWKKKQPLWNGRKGTYVDRTALLKVSKDNYSLGLPPGPTIIVEKEKKTWNQVSVVLLGSFGILILITIACIFAMFVGSRRKRNQKALQQANVPEFSLRAFTYKELEEATNGFKDELGRGAFGTVYKGVLPSIAIGIAVKKLDRLIKETEKEFMNEVRSIGQTHHKNLVKLFGYCNEGTHRLLVYEYMSNGSLMDFLFGEVKPHWIKRIQIILGTARGLLYLHEECSTPIIHCDIKPQNVLLDDNLVAKISDFGLAKLMSDQTRTYTGIKGTKGYVAPEWFKRTAITKKVDVYSFGVMMLEIICCKKNLDTDIVLGEESEEPVLIYWAYDYYNEGRLDVLVQNEEEALADIAQLERFVKVAIWCIQDDPAIRPSMQKVTQMLEGADDVPVPPEPSSFLSAV